MCGPRGLSLPQVPAQAHQVAWFARELRDAHSHQLLVWSLSRSGSWRSCPLGWAGSSPAASCRRLSTITAAARTISASNLDRRLAFAGPNDELKELGDTFDEPARQARGLVRAQRQFVANASHELRTPLARQRTVAQVALADPEATVESLREAHERVLRRGRQQERLLEALLTLTRGQAGLDRREPFDLADLTDEVLLARSPRRGSDGLEVHIGPPPAPAVGDPRSSSARRQPRRQRAAPQRRSRRVDVTTPGRKRGTPSSRSSNTGPVVPPDEVERLFEPFQRLDDAHRARRRPRSRPVDRAGDRRRLTTRPWLSPPTPGAA